MRLSAAQSRLVFVVLMATGMSFAMSLVMSLVMLGFDRWTLLKWLKAWGIALLVALPVAYLWVPVAQRLASGISGGRRAGG